MKLLVAFVLSWISTNALAESKITQAPYELHFTTLPSTFLPKEVTTAHQIKRSKSRGVLSITILDTTHQPAKAIKADVKVTAKNLLGQSKTIDMKTITEGEEATYYLAMYMMNNSENIHFTIEAKPESSKRIIRHQFTREFFTD